MSIYVSIFSKNEEEQIENLLSSVLPLIDTFCICDTGSSDRTISIVQNFFEKKKMKGKIIHKKFKNFEFNRNYTL